MFLVGSVGSPTILRMILPFLRS